MLQKYDGSKNYFCATLIKMENQKKAGRPKLPKGAAKTTMVRARVSPEEMRKMEEAAMKAGMVFSDWARKTLLEAT